ncbi:AAA family ATPase [Oscillatoria amoena NRMC-F 0135]|nr:AAA family ATPase [Oscillatoria amoena NRMC-F 0135]
MATIEEIAEQLKGVGEYIVCIYAFNATGKTRLSVAYKDLTKTENGGEHAGVYYNAYSEDLFDWDNDEDNDNKNIKLNLKRSSLNRLYSLITEESVQEELSVFNPIYKFKFITNANPEIGVEAIRFFKEEKEDISIKISSGETRTFIWCFFLALFKLEGWADKQNAHFFIDDPVTSLDDNNVFLTADTLMRLIEDNFETDRKVILTTHHVGLFSVLYDRLKYGEKADRYKRNCKHFILRRNQGQLELKAIESEVFLFHLHLLQVLDEARKTKLFTYHFVLLRQLLENIVSFLGKSQIKFVLQEIGVDKPDETITMLNSLSHKKVFVPQFNEMNENEIIIFNEIFEKLLVKYKFKF